MIRVLLYVIAVFLLAAGFVWLADRPGDLLVNWQGYEVRTSVMVAAVGVLAVIAVIALIGAILRAIIRTPRTVGNFFGARRRDRGYRALTRGMIALGAGDSRAARRAAQESQSLLGEKEPLVLLLSAQAAQIAGENAAARSAFTALSEDPETRVLGLHGLFVEARRQGEHAAARHFAEEAVRVSPRIAWAGPALFEYQCQAGEWQGALRTLASNADAGLVDRDRTRRLRAVLLTGLAMEREAGAPDEARGHALEAHRLAPELVPAAVVAAHLLTRHGDIRRATRVLEATWKIAPHPEIAEAYAEVRPGDSVRDRLKRVKRLSDMHANHAEGAMAVARAAIDAHDWQVARDALGGLVRLEPTERVCLLMAEIEEGEHGDQGRVRGWLTRALTASRDPVWTADGRVFEHWAPVSPVSGRVDAFEWKVLADRLPPPRRHVEIEAAPDDDDDEPAPPATPVIAAEPVATKPVAPFVPPPPVTPAAAPAPAKPPVETKPVSTEPKPAEARPADAKNRERDLMPRVPDDPGPPRRADEDERYKVY